MERTFSKISNNTTSLVNKDVKLPQSLVTKKRKRNQQLDGDVYIESEPSVSKYRRIKLTKAQKNGKGRSKQQKQGSIDNNSIKETTLHHESPKIWDIFERHQKFSQRRLLTRSKSGLLESPDEGDTKEIPQKNGTKALSSEKYEKDSTNRNIITNNESIEVLSDSGRESLSGGDRKRRLVDCEEEQYDEDGKKRKPQPASTFKPKRLNFYEIDDPTTENDTKTKTENNSSEKAKFSKDLQRLFC